MKIKRIVLFLIIGWVCYLVFSHRQFLPHLELIARGYHINYVFNVAILILAYYYRAINAHRLVSNIRESSNSLIFKSISVGTFFNLILPFRLGEFARAIYLGKALNISRTVMFITVVIERIFDCIVLSFLCLCVLFIYTLNNENIDHLSLMYLLPLSFFALGLFLFYGLFIIYYQNPKLLKACYIFSSIFNDSLRDQIRFTLWSTIHGIHVVLKSTNLFKHFYHVILMWCVYIFASFFLLHIHFDFTGLKGILMAILSHMSIVVPSDPGAFSTFNFFASRSLQNLNIQSLPVNLPLLMWFLQTIPISILGGLFFFFWKKPIEDSKTKPIEIPKLIKFDRGKDLSREFGYFLEEYFSGQKISWFVNQFELNDNVYLIDSFKGGSNALTLLLSSNATGKQFVRKITLSPFRKKLKDQADWLKTHQNDDMFPKILGEGESEHYYFYDLQYFKDATTFFDYIHANPIEQSINLLKKIITYLKDDIYQKTEIQTNKELFSQYLEEKVITKTLDCSSLSEKISNLLPYDTLIINGEEYKNFFPVLNKIIENSKAIGDLSQFYQVNIHGDLTVENILVDNDQLILLDPNNENSISDPIVDYGKLYQSVHSGYEFLCQIKTITIKHNRITFDENISYKYKMLYAYLSDFFKSTLEENRYKSLLFHEATHFCRMLTYRAKIQPETVPIFYSISVRLFNEFIDQYD
jgi:uncharacterized protein (TIRG00374 family)